MSMIRENQRKKAVQRKTEALKTPPYHSYTRA